MKEIPLTQSKVALVDNEDYGILSKWKWFYSPSGGTGYAIRNNRKQDGKWGKIFMHRVILNTPLGYETDHINQNGLDNRKINLRVATQSQNNWNRGKQQNNTSGFKGVSWHKNKEKWEARIRLKGKRIHLGLFKNKPEAARAYNKAAIRLHGEFARLNQIGN